VKGRRKASAMDRILAWQRQITAEQIARAIEADAAGPGGLCEDPYCPDFVRHEAKRQAAALPVRPHPGAAQPQFPPSLHLVLGLPGGGLR